MRKSKVLIVDDGSRYAELAHALIRQFDYATRCELPGPCWECPKRKGCTLTHAHDWSELNQALAKHTDIDLILLDVMFDLDESRLLPDSEGRPLKARKRTQGLRILEKLRRMRADLPVILMTARDDLPESAVEIDADEYVSLAGTDTFDARALALLMERALSRRGDIDEDERYVWGKSSAMKRLRQDATALARTSLPMLIEGETGTGKSALAERVVHLASKRTGPFVAVDISSLPPNLVASELFGTSTGSFSGATDREGRFERANGGTIFLDEIASLPADAQRMLLLVLQDKRVTRLGENHSRPLDVKVIAASNTKLEREVRAGRFRADLYARLNPAARLSLPPLRERRSDIELLLQRFVEQTFLGGPDRKLLSEYMETVGLSGSCEANFKVATPRSRASRRGVTFTISKAVLSALTKHHWPGNLREAELLIQTAVLSTLSDAVALASRSDAELDTPELIPLPAKLVRELIEGSWVGSPSASVEQSEIQPKAHLRDVARELETDLLKRLFFESDGNFEEMAKKLLEGDPVENAKRVRLRFNQLGLSARKLRSM